MSEVFPQNKQEISKHISGHSPNKVAIGNKLNELSAQEWLKFTKTWFVHNPPPRKKNEVLHPAKYPESMIEEFVKFFTKKGQLVFDPFLGTGSTLVACHNAERNGVGIELQEKYSQIARQRLQEMESQLKLVDDGARLNCKQLVIQGDSFKIADYWKEYSLPEIDFLITSPPYGPMLNKKGLASKEREDKGLDTKYSEEEQDLGNVQDYDLFVEKLVDLFSGMKKLLKVGAYLVVILQNYREGSEFRTLAWDFAASMRKHFTLSGVKVWCQDNKTLYPYGYRYSFVPNVHHHYCLIFKKVEEKND
ncbi:MAG: site-specific DNA-methyltransferase [Nanoarchaeota archaeon]|nr:site-specific DNA-methyltransferase [Nanoarchaeota archaeon]MBU1622332.1 site-specific DNA-methyltransferase [Nanoarchaeota archaeon]MBU1974111.1 site-specific DNA-methyltransferase [Nanoarchaeota archaeon]